MGVLKIIIISAITVIILFVLLVIYSLSPTIRNVSDEKALGPFINIKLKLKRAGFIQVFEEGQYRFRSDVLTDYIQYPNERKHELPIGTEIIIKEFKTYRSNLGSGFTNLFGLGEAVLPSGEKIEFEYSWGNIDRDKDLEVKHDLPISTPIWDDKNEK